MFRLALNLGAEETRTLNAMSMVESFTEASQSQTNSEKAFNASKPVVGA
jgi:hypothetical protein